MKFLPLILILCGCRGSTPNAPAPVASARPSATIQSAEAAAPAPVYTLHIVYHRPMTNCWLECTTDLVNWDVCSDFTVNPDGSWTVSRGGNLQKFFRVGGDLVTADSRKP